MPARKMDLDCPALHRVLHLDVYIQRECTAGSREVAGSDTETQQDQQNVLHAMRRNRGCQATSVARSLGD